MLISSPSSCLLLFRLLRHNHRPGPVLSDSQVRATSETVSILGDGAENTQTDTAYKSNADYIAMTEASRSEVHVNARRQDQVPASRHRTWQE